MTQTQRMGLGVFLYLIISLLVEIAGVNDVIETVLMVVSVVAYGLFTWGADADKKKE